MVVEAEALVVYARILGSRLPLKMTGNFAQRYIKLCFLRLVDCGKSKV